MKSKENTLKKKKKKNEIKKQRKREEKEKKRLAEKEEKRKNPKINVNGWVGSLKISEDKIIITAKARKYEILYSDITDVSGGRDLIIKTRNNEFKILPGSFGYMFLIEEYYSEILENREKYMNINKDSVTDSTDELEKIMEMYQKGLLTDEEFTVMKKKIIEK